MSYQTHTLPSGLRIIHKYIDAPVSYLGFGIGVGTRDESHLEHGIAHFMEHMLFKGTPRRSSMEIIELIEGVGGELNAYTSKEETMLYAVFPNEYVERALELLCDIVQNSHFPDEELRKEQTVVLDEISSYEDSPSDLIFDEFENMLFRGHALGHNILGTEKSVSRFNSARLKRFFSRYYQPSNMILFSQGAIDFALLISLASQYLGGASEAKYSFIKPDASTIFTPNPVRRQLRRRDTHQRHVLIGGYAYPRHDSRRLAVSVLVNLLGGPSLNSRLNLALRERTGFVYHVECSYTAYADTGMISIYFGCAPGNMEQAIDLVEEELRRLIASPLTEEELEATKRQLKGQLMVSHDNRETTFMSMGKNYLHHGRVDDLPELIGRVDAVSADQLHEVARDLLDPSKLHRLIYT
ncbi:MAG: pitrilysin family protein [Porphyromonadaceae bacterium]|nr:pitrilysin family protein [Porphyromonadaceae bacterium]